MTSSIRDQFFSFWDLTLNLSLNFPSAYTNNYLLRTIGSTNSINRHIPLRLFWKTFYTVSRLETTRIPIHPSFFFSFENVICLTKNSEYEMCRAKKFQTQVDEAARRYYALISRVVCVMDLKHCETGLTNLRGVFAVGWSTAKCFEAEKIFSVVSLGSNQALIRWNEFCGRVLNLSHWVLHSDHHHGPQIWRNGGTDPVYRLGLDRRKSGWDQLDSREWCQARTMSHLFHLFILGSE